MKRDLIGLIILAIAAVWCIITFFDNWNLILTDEQKLMLYWKPVVLVFIGYFLIRFKKK